MQIRVERPFIFKNKKYLKGSIHEIPDAYYVNLRGNVTPFQFCLSGENKYLLDYELFTAPLSYKMDGYGRTNRWFQDNCQFNPKSDTMLLIGTPMLFTIVPYEKQYKKKVIITMFESDRLPEHWIQLLNENADLILVPSKWCQRVFRKSGIKVPVKLLPLFYIPEVGAYSDQKDNVFTFGHQNAFVMGHQKGDDAVLEAFTKEFGDNMNVRLILKGRNHHYQALDHEFIQKSLQHKNVESIIQDYDDMEIYSRFYSRLHCFVFPSRGEGFGIPPLEAMAQGIPAIVTHGHSLLDYKKFTIGIKASGFVDSYYVGRSSDGGESKRWVQINIDNLRRQMRLVFENYQKYKDQAERNKEIIKKLYSPSSFMERLKNIL